MENAKLYVQFYTIKVLCLVTMLQGIFLGPARPIGPIEMHGLLVHVLLATLYIAFTGYDIIY